MCLVGRKKPQLGQCSRRVIRWPLQVSQFASVLVSRGVVKGDRVLIYMPMIPEAIVAMLACARLGAVHSLVFGGFASKELATRINHAEVRRARLLSTRIPTFLPDICSSRTGLGLGSIFPATDVWDGVFPGGRLGLKDEFCIANT